MKHIQSTLLCWLFAMTTTKMIAQVNPSAAILPVNPGGVVVQGAVMDIRVTISNTGTGNIVAFKLRPNITMPPIVSILPTAQQTGLPPNWSVVTNTGNGQIRICNGTDVIAGGESREIFIKVEGVTMGGPSSCEVQIQYGGASCAAVGPQPSGNNGIDDFAASSVTVTSGPLPLTLVSFHATLTDCIPSLNWQTENEINTSHFDIEKQVQPSGTWTGIGTVSAAATSGKYSFRDNAAGNSNQQLLYRLKMTDMDGHYRYSPVLPVATNCNTVGCNLFPNPVTDGKLYVSLTGTTTKTEGKLMNITGQVISASTLNNGTNYLNTSGIANGTYIYHIRNEDGLDKKFKVIINQ